ncbi:MAG: NAD(P)/FAD-dependent oxidoreductase [Candidatus Eremiobacteraeota bacterium]|nr:NAD(P)/FAD-dependent oxidoreductase [Candidatus Eremiobacteraeota bacterium]
MRRKPHKVVVVGAGFGGLAAVRAIPDTPEFEVTLVDRRNHHLFQALLYQVATAGLNASEIASPVRAIFRERRNVSVLMSEFTGLDREAKVAIFDEGEMTLEYDTLVLAVGGETSYFGNDHWKEHSFGLKSIEEALAIRKRVLLAFEEAEKTNDPLERERLMSIVVIGGGPTGVELSGAFAELRSHVLRWDFRRIDPNDARIVLLEGGPRVLGVFPESLSRAAENDLERLGVEVRLGERVTDISEGQVSTSRGEIPAHTVIWAWGVSGHPVSQRCGLVVNRAGRVRVSESLQIEDGSIFCIGDMAEFVDPDSGQPLPAMAPVAMQQGRHCGENVVRLARGEAPEPFLYQDPGIMATVGRTRGVASLNGRLYSGSQGWLMWLWHHLLRIVDFQNRVLVSARWAWAYLGWKWGVRLVYDTIAESGPRRRNIGDNPPDSPLERDSLPGSK